MNHKRESILWVEGLGFGFIIVSVWLTELFHVPHFLFAEAGGINLERALLRTIVVSGVWLAVHIGTRRLLQRLYHLEEYLRICSWCRKIGHEGEWMTMEEYFGSALATKMTHGVCPECSRNLRPSAKRMGAKTEMPSGKI